MWIKGSKVWIVGYIEQFKLFIPRLYGIATNVDPRFSDRDLGAQTFISYRMFCSYDATVMPDIGVKGFSSELGVYIIPV